MEKNEAAKKLEEGLSGGVLEKAPFGRGGDPSVWVEVRSLAKAAGILASDSGLSMDWLENLSVSQLDDTFVLTYFIRSRASGARLVLRASAAQKRDDAEPFSVPTVCAAWPMAEQMENEAAEMFGIRFGEKRPEGWPGFPLRKTYVFPRETLGIAHSRGGVGNV